MVTSKAMRLKRKVVGYIRVSTPQQEETTSSLAKQAKTIREWAALHGHELLSIYEDIGSGRVPGKLVRRGGLQMAIEDANREGAVIVVTRLDRLSRNTDDAESIAATINEGVISIDDDHARAGVRSKATILKAVSAAQIQAEKLAEKTAESLQKIAASGKKLGSPSAGRQAAALASAKVRRINADVAIENVARVLAESEENMNLTTRELMVLLNSRKFYSGSRRPWTLEGLREPRRKALRLLEEQAALDAEEDDGPFAESSERTDDFPAFVPVSGGGGLGRGSNGSQTGEDESGAALDEEEERRRHYAKNPLFGMF